MMGWNLFNNLALSVWQKRIISSVQLWESPGHALRCLRVTLNYCVRAWIEVNSTVVLGHWMLPIGTRNQNIWFNRPKHKPVSNVNWMGHSTSETGTKLLCPIHLGLVAGSLFEWSILYQMFLLFSQPPVFGDLEQHGLTYSTPDFSLQWDLLPITCQTSWDSQRALSTGLVAAHSPSHLSSVHWQHSSPQSMNFNR